MTIKAIDPNIVAGLAIWKPSCVQPIFDALNKTGAAQMECRSRFELKRTQSNLGYKARQLGLKVESRSRGLTLYVRRLP